MPLPVTPPDLLGNCRVVMCTNDGYEEPLVIVKIEQVPRFTEQSLTRIYVKPPLSLVKE